MQITSRLSPIFKAFPDLIVQGFDGRINYKVVEQIKSKNLYSEFAAWGLTGKIWWDKKENYWCAEIWKKAAYLTTYCGETIEDLLTNIFKFSGWK